MGCDIHLHAEVKVNGKWLHYSHISVPRSYELFGKMAGVRDKEVTPIDFPRGIPNDISEVTLIDLGEWDGDAHSASFLNSKEIAVLAEWIDGRESDYFGFFFGNDYSSFYLERNECPQQIQDVRFVFWFDN